MSKEIKVKLNVSKKLKKVLRKNGSKKLVKYLKYLQVHNLFKKEKHSKKVNKFLKTLDDNLFRELELFISNYTYSKRQKNEEKQEQEDYSSCR